MQLETLSMTQLIDRRKDGYRGLFMSFLLGGFCWETLESTITCIQKESGTFLGVFGPLWAWIWSIPVYMEKLPVDIE